MVNRHKFKKSKRKTKKYEVHLRAYNVGTTVTVRASSVTEARQKASKHLKVGRVHSHELMHKRWRKFCKEQEKNEKKSN